MDAFKFAFETVIVGVLALPWLAILLSLIFPKLRLNGSSEELGLLAILPEGFRDTAKGALLVSMAYVLGSVVIPLSADLLDDEHWEEIPVVKVLPTEHRIRTQVYRDLKDIVAGSEMWLRKGSGAPAIGDDDREALRVSCASDSLCEDKANNAAGRILGLQEAALLAEGTDKSDRLRRLHERILVLAGATFNGFLCSLICLFAFCAQWAGNLRTLHRPPRWRRGWAALLPVSLVFGAAYLLYLHLKKPDVADPPTMELILLVLGSSGVWFFLRDVSPRRYLSFCVIASLLTLGAYGGWWWTEAQYDKQVIYAFAALSEEPAGKPTQ